MKDASASVRAKEKEEERTEKINMKKKKKQPEACILGENCRAPPPWIGPRLLIVKEGKVNKEGVILGREEKYLRGSATISLNF